MKVSRISAITLIVLLLIVGICSCQSTKEYHCEGFQQDSEARFEEEYIDQIIQLLKGLEYSNKVAEDFVRMISDWRDSQGKLVFISWKQRLNQIEVEYKLGKISKDQFAKVEENVTRELSQRIQKEISYNIKFSDLADVIKHRQAQCVSYSQLVYILGNSVGLSFEVIDVEKPFNGVLITGWGHIASIVNLADGKMIMVDLIPGSFISKTFILEKEYSKDGNYWELKDNDNPLGIHRKFQIFDRYMLIATIYCERAIVYCNSEQYQKAFSFFEKAIKLNPKHTSAYINRGTAYIDLGQYDQAILDFDKAIELNPNFDTAYYNRGVAFRKSRKFDLAISDFTRTIELNVEFTAAYYNRGTAYLVLDQYCKAISDLTDAIKLDAGYALAYYSRGIAYASIREFEKAKKDLVKAVELIPTLKSFVKGVSDSFKLDLKLE
jgi:tetratricopeptide (TPR) repeat protein